MNTLEKVKKWLDEHDIEYEYEESIALKSITISTSLNTYYYITLSNDNYKKNRRTIITDNSVGVQLEDKNGNVYEGNYSRRISFIELKNQLEIIW